MRTTLLLFSTILVMIVGCSKNNPPTVDSITSVTISGDTYPVVKIGTQLWTAQNYDGPGGIASPYSDEATVGKFYTLPQVNSLMLPSGWRVPTVDDYVKLFKSQDSVTNNGWGDYLLGALGSTHLRSSSNWQIGGDNKSGFDVPGAGYYLAGQVYNRNAFAYFWTSSIPVDSAYAGHRSIMVMQGYSVIIGTQKTPITTSAISVYKPLIGSFTLRFVKDN